MLIGEASKFSGATVKAIRYYESIGLLPNITRNGKYRTFQQSDIAVIKLIKKAQEIGLKLSDLKIMTDPEGMKTNNESIWLNIMKTLDEQNHQLDIQIKQLQIQKKLLSGYKKQISTCLSSSPNCSFPKL